MKNNALMQLVLARLREFIREPAAIFWVYGFPLIMAIALGLAFRDKPVEQTVRLDVQEGPLAEDVREGLSDERFMLEVSSEEEWNARLRSGTIELVVIPKKVEEEIEYEYVFDPTRPGSLLARNAANEALQIHAGRHDLVEVADTEFKKPGGRYIDFLIPGLLGMSLMGGGLWGVGFAIVDLRLRKLLKRFIATPMRRSHFLAAVMISRMIFMIPEMILMIVFARIFFAVEIHGSAIALLVIILIGAVQFSGIGLLIASRAQTMESVSGLMNLVMLPMWICSGIFFKSENFPDFMQPAITFLPLTPLIRALRGIMSDDVGLSELVPEMLMMTAWGAVTFVIALVIFRWK